MQHNRIFLCLLLMAALLLSLPGCGSYEPVPSSSAAYTEPATGNKHTPTEVPLASEAASVPVVKEYLLPLETFSRERVCDPEFVMIHFISAVSLSRNDPYNMHTIRSIFEDYELSVHYIIDREGTIRCYIPEDLVAYHAGKGTWNNDPKYTDKLNDYAIGIEVVAMGSQADMRPYLTTDEYNQLDPNLLGYTDAQYAALKILVRDICQRNHIPMDRQHIIGHEEYSSSKTDPGELFDWARLLS